MKDILVELHFNCDQDKMIVHTFCGTVLTYNYPREISWKQTSCPLFFFVAASCYFLPPHPPPPLYGFTHNEIL